jgi:NTP pyrophosphatase (non-canonical NTP hydrolase)
MEKHFKKVKSLNKKDAVGIELALCKLFEEAGELAQAVNMKIGRKATKMTDKEIKDNIAEECIDTIQNVFCVADKAGITYKQLFDIFEKKNLKWESRIKNKEINLKGNTKV